MFAWEINVCECLEMHAWSECSGMDAWNCTNGYPIEVIPYGREARRKKGKRVIVSRQKRGGAES